MRKSVAKYVDKVGKVLHNECSLAVLHILATISTQNLGFCGKFSEGFCTVFYICKIGGFTHFPQGLLL